MAAVHQLLLAVLLLALASSCIVEALHRPPHELRVRRMGSRVREVRRLVELGVVSTASNVQVPLYGNQTVMGEYYIEFTVGSPPQSFSAQCMPSFPPKCSSLAPAGLT